MRRRSRGKVEAPTAMERHPRRLQVPRPAPARLDAFLASRLPGYSVEQLRGLIERGLVRIDGTLAKVRRRLHGGETVELELPAPKRLPPVEGPRLRALLSREDLLVIDKPAGIVVEPEPGQVSIRELAATQFDGFDVGGVAAPGIVHRLDKGTTGCLLLAKSDEAQAALTAAFRDHSVRKIYLALVQGRPPAEGHLDTPYGRDPRAPGRFTTRCASPRRARLSFRVEERWPSHGDRPEAARLEVRLETGRTHQIRVQLSEAGFPLLGDALYGVSHPLIDRPALHAARLVVTGVGPRVDCSSPLPDDLQHLQQALAALRTTQTKPQ